MKLALQTLLSGLVGVAFFALTLFVPAGTVHYWQAWVFIAVFMLTTLGPSIYLAIDNPAALQRRMRAGPTAETRPVQRIVISGTFALVVLLLVVSALDHRFGWSSVPLPITVVGFVLVATGLLLAQLVVVQNNYAAATITVEAGQTLVSSGLYGWVRHPMYAGALLMMIGVPPALDSYWGLVVVLPSVLVLAVRIVDEETMLSQDLAGYHEYMAQVRYRLVPYVW
jgi:protein-S-isoprenylcysteine O-methyltransferase Ste14